MNLHELMENHAAAVASVTAAEEEVDQCESAKGLALQFVDEAAASAANALGVAKSTLRESRQANAEALRAYGEAKDAELAYRTIRRHLSADIARAKYRLHLARIEEREAWLLVIDANFQDHIAREAQLVSSLAEVEGGSVTMAIDSPKREAFKRELTDTSAAIQSMRGRLPMEEIALQVALEAAR